jgi:hypothetical protein
MTQRITITVKDALQAMLTVPGSNNAWNTAINTALNPPTLPGVPNPFDSILDQEIVVPTPQWVLDLLVPVSTTPIPTPGGDPVTPLEAIATALGSAERRLNDDNLVISQATVEISMSVDVPGIAGADTTIKFGVEPRAL